MAGRLTRLESVSKNVLENFVQGAFVDAGAFVDGADGVAVSSLLQPANTKLQTRARRTTSDNLVFIQGEFCRN